MSDQALQSVPKFYNERNQPIHNLEEAKAMAAAWMKETFDFRTKLDEKLQNVEDITELGKLQEYLYNSALYGFGLKVKNQRSNWK